MPKFSREPAVYTAVATAVLDVVCVLLPVVPELKVALVALITTVAGVFVRSQVTPV